MWEFLGFSKMKKTEQKIQKIYNTVLVTRGRKIEKIKKIYNNSKQN